MKRLTSFLSASLVATACLAAPAFAQDAGTAPPAATPAATPAITVSGNVAIVSEYRFRGISQSDGDLAIQGGLTVSHKSGFYLSTWASNLGGFGTYGGANMELDLIGGYKHSFGKATVDGGLLWYVYPGTSGHNYAEPYLNVSAPVGPVSVKVGANYAPKQREIGNEDSLYVYGEASVTIPHTPVTLLSHFGHTDGRGAAPAGPTGHYDDWSLGAAYSWKMLTLNVSYVDTDIRRADADAFYTSGSTPGHKIADGAVVASLTASF